MRPATTQFSQPASASTDPSGPLSQEPPSGFPSSFNHRTRLACLAPDAIFHEMINIRRSISTIAVSQIFFYRSTRRIRFEPLANQTLQDLTEFSSDARPPVVSRELGRRSPLSAAQVPIVEQCDHELRKANRRVGKNHVPPVVHVESLGTHGRRNYGLTHRHRFVNLEPRTAAHSQWHRDNRGLPQMFHHGRNASRHFHRGSRKCLHAS